MAYFSGSPLTFKWSIHWLNKNVSFWIIAVFLFLGSSAQAQVICGQVLNKVLVPKKLQQVIETLQAVVKGQDPAIIGAVVTKLIGGHLLLEGEPGTGKTLLAKATANVFGSSFSRIQFTSDIVPANIIGHKSKDRITGELIFHPGPIFANIVVADEINRGPQKSQSALLEVMQERQVTLDGVTHKVPKNFFMIATQNPNDHRGTNHLLEAQLDRITMRIIMPYPQGKLRREINEMAQDDRAGITNLAAKTPVMIPEADLENVLPIIRRVEMPEAVSDFVFDLIDAIQNPAKVRLEEMASFRKTGVSPRADQDLILAAKAYAWMYSRRVVDLSDVKRFIEPVIAHRIQLQQKAISEGKSQEEILAQFVQAVELQHQARASGK